MNNHVILMKEIVGDTVKAKALGGVRDYAACMELINAGVDRIGASASVIILKDVKEQ